MKELYTYTNGNVNTTIYEDGTRKRQYEGGPNFSFPENIDIKITNYCDMSNVCTYCHEQSNTSGTHGDLSKLITVLGDLPAGIELAIGGGSTTSHPDLINFLVEQNSIGHIANLTVNQLHLKAHKSLIKEVISRNLIKGIGISYRSGMTNLSYLSDYEHSVIHLIAGIDEHSIIPKLMSLGYKKFLVLGYKTFGNGIEYYHNNNNSVNQNIKMWRSQITRYLGNGVVISFDNLAIEQLLINRFFTKTEWNTFYQGDDFTCSMYIDAVKEEYAPTSRSSLRVPFDKMSLFEYFNQRERYIDVTEVNI